MFALAPDGTHWIEWFWLKANNLEKCETSGEHFDHYSHIIGFFVVWYRSKKKVLRGFWDTFLALFFENFFFKDIYVKRYATDYTNWNFFFSRGVYISWKLKKKIFFFRIFTEKNFIDEKKQRPGLARRRLLGPRYVKIDGLGGFPQQLHFFRGSKLTC